MTRLLLGLLSLLALAAPTHLHAAVESPPPGKDILAWRDEGTAEIRTIPMRWSPEVGAEHIDRTVKTLQLTRREHVILCYRRQAIIAGHPYSLIAYRERPDAPITITGVLIKERSATRVEATCTLEEYGPTLLSIMDIATR